MANSLFKPFNLVDGVFVNNYVSHKSSFKDFWKWRRESSKPEPIAFPIVENDPEYLKSNKSEKTFLLEIRDNKRKKDPREYIWVELNNIAKIANNLKEGETLWSLDFQIDSNNLLGLSVIDKNFDAQKLWPDEN